MIVSWFVGPKGLVRNEASDDAAIRGAVWIDLCDPSKEDEVRIEKLCAIDIPTRAEMQEIEASSRLYREDGALFVTATMLVKTETESPESTAVTFVLTRERLITIRYAEPWSFRTFATRASKSGAQNAEQAFCEIMDTTIERLADMLELVAMELDHLSHQVFRRHHPNKSQQASLDLQKAIIKTGSCGLICSKVRESLIDKNRIVSYAESHHEWSSSEHQVRLKGLLRDIQTLSDHATFTASKIQFMLDATLGLINIEQNRIIKIFSIAAVIFMPPTLVASIYGMNFVHMPELDKVWGYPMALGIMLAAVGGTLYYFRRRHWM
jgi:magnesium transporter